jgi:hypothetical protein
VTVVVRRCAPVSRLLLCRHDAERPALCGDCGRETLRLCRGCCCAGMMPSVPRCAVTVVV